MELAEIILYTVVEVAIKFFEYMGVIVIIYSGIRGVIHYVKRDTKTQIVLFKGLSMGLGFALGGEILHTFVARDLKDVALVGGIIVLRVALTFLMHWEMKAEEGHSQHGHEEE